MNSAMTTSSRMKFMAGATALVATMLTTGATLALAESYAHRAADGQLSMAVNPANHCAAAVARNADAGGAADLS